MKGLDSKVVLPVLNTLLLTDAHVATKYLDPKRVVRATRISYKSGKKGRRKFAPADKEVEVRLHVGRPNYLEREFVVKCKKAREPFPVKKIQLKFLPQGKP